jgi:phosphatidylserine/phosphatidylglycerophosphate/cardiolipin synthase-like enzyme
MKTWPHWRWRALPAGLSVEGATHWLKESDVEFIGDVTYMDEASRVSEQALFDRVLQVIRGAEDFILADFFLFNDYLGRERAVHRRLSNELARALVERKQTLPGIRIIVITDPVNEAYGGSVSAPLRALRDAGIPVVFTRLEALRDPNTCYSAFWRTFVQWFGTSPGGLWPHPLSPDAGGVGLRSWLALLNFKANHRKLLIADAPAGLESREMVAMVLSANPHDGSSAHSNVGLLVRGGVWRDLLLGEQAVLNFSGNRCDAFAGLPSYASSEAPSATHGSAFAGLAVRVISEGKIRSQLLAEIESAGCGDAIDIGMFYISERETIGALLRAGGRGAVVRLLLDPNREAFGYEKNGLPNRAVATELLQRGQGQFSVRWFNTHGEQFHPKLVLFKKGGQRILFAGSANLTRRNLNDFNLETDLMVAGDSSAAALKSAELYFERLWSNDGHEFSLPIDAHKHASWFQYWQYRFLEWTGMTTF